MKLFTSLLVLLIVVTACGGLSTTPVPTIESSPTTEATETALPPTSTVPAASQTPRAVTFPDATGFTWAPVATGFVSPTDIEFPDDGSGRMFVLEQAGQIRIVKGGKVASGTFLDINSKVGSAGNEQGLLGLAFHPDFKANPYFYVNYTDVNGNTVIARFTAKGDVADPASQKDLIHVDQPFPNHNGGVLRFRPGWVSVRGVGRWRLRRRSLWQRSK